MYKPAPLDLTKVKVPNELIDLTEKIAENVHENWAFLRMQSGWKYGEFRNDELKETPCLVSYDELPEEEKEYDRNTAIETIKLIMSLGYEIRKKL